MQKHSLYLIIALLAVQLTACNTPAPVHPSDRLVSEIDSIMHLRDFNGVVLLSKDTTALYHEAFGYANLDSLAPLKRDDQFVIGSISKQITAALVMRAVDDGKIDLSAPLSRYYPEGELNWADSVTIHQLLTHTHGITALDQPLQYTPGSQFAYSQIGFHLLSVVLERVYDRSFLQLSGELFQEADLHYTFHPKSSGYQVIPGYEEDTSGVYQQVENSLGHYPAAGAFISTARDLARWNTRLHSSHLMNEQSLNLMKKPYAVRKHALFGNINYGYGLLFYDDEADFMIGATGYAPGFASMNFYFPESHLSLIVLTNMPRDSESLQHTFDVHIELLNAIRSWQANQ